MSRSRRRSVLPKVCLGAGLAVASPTACDRGDAPAKHEQPPTAAPVNGAKSTTTDALTTAPSDTPTGESTPPQQLPKPSRAVETPRVDTPSTAKDEPRTGGDAFIPPTIEMSGRSDFERKMIEASRQAALDAPGSADRIAELGMHYCVRAHSKAAADCFRRATELLPRAMKFHYLLGIALEEAGEPVEARKAFRRSIELEDKYPAAYVNLGRLLLDVDTIEARNMFEAAIRLDSTDSIAMWGLGRCAQLENRDDDAITAYRKAIELQPNYRDAHQQLAGLLREKGLTAEADEHDRQASEGDLGLIRNDPLRYEMSMFLRTDEDIAREAVEAALSGKVDQAIGFLRASMRRGVTGAAIYRALAEVFIIDRRFDEAVIQAQKALELAPEDVLTKIVAATTYINVGDLDSAEALLKSVPDGVPQMHAVENRLGGIDLMRGRLKEAESRLRRAIELQPGEAHFHMNLAQCLAASKRFDEAFMEVRRALDLKPEDPDIQLVFGRIAIDTGRFQDAEPNLRKHITVRPNSEPGYVYLAMAHRSLGNEAESMRCLDAGFRQLPNSAAIANDLAYMLVTCETSSLRNPTRAIELAKRACELTHNESPGFIETLATAHAAAGDFRNAAATMERAIKLFANAGAGEADLKPMRERLFDYESKSDRPVP